MFSCPYKRSKERNGSRKSAIKVAALWLTGRRNVANLEPMEETGDFELMNRIRNNDQAAFLALVRRHQSSLVNFFHRLGAYTDAEDLVQETFLRLFKYRFKYRPDAKFTTFLYMLARHAWADGLRKQKKQEDISERVVAEAASVNRVETHGAQMSMDAQAALDVLPEKLRVVLVMSFYQGLRYEDIAEILGVPVGTVKSRVFLAMERMREAFNV
jgi:RNA polymerase sigma factor (sigma-70 family)